jgi:hypothetical protein
MPAHSGGRSVSALWLSGRRVLYGWVLPGAADRGCGGFHLAGPGSLAGAERRDARERRMITVGPPGGLLPALPEPP